MKKIEVQRYCLSCGKLVKVTVLEKDYLEMLSGKHIQEVLHYLSPEEREILISGVCGECFDKLFPEEEDGDD